MTAFGARSSLGWLAAVVSALVLSATLASAQSDYAKRKVAPVPPAAAKAVKPGLLRAQPRVMAPPRATLPVAGRPTGAAPAASSTGPQAYPSAPRPGVASSGLPRTLGDPRRGAGVRPGMTPGGALRGNAALGSRPGQMLPGRPGLRAAPNAAMLPRPTGRFGASPAWGVARQRFFVAPPRSVGPPPGLGFGRTRHEMEYSGVPPAGERRFVQNEVVVQVARRISRDEIERVSRALGISVVATHSFDAADRTLYQFRAADGRDVSAVIRQLEQNNIVAAAQPNYVYTLDQAAVGGAEAVPPRQPKASLPPAGPTPLAGLPPRALPAGDPTQYAVTRLNLAEVHRVARGRDIRIAVIDSEIDTRHPDISGAISDRFDPTGQPSRPHAHGTGMAGAIVARSRLLGIAPEASVVAIKAFDERRASAEATSFQILKGLDEAMRRGVRVINMSFAGPYDVMLERKLREAYDKGIVLVAAAGNAGPKSPPLYPAADPSVIAVTATDSADKPFAMANVGNHIAIAAPGVDILVPAPANTYQLTTGTSVAAAEVSGVVALMLQRRPDLTPEDVRAILVGSAKPLPPMDGNGEVGLVDPLKALTYEPAVSEATAAATEAPVAPASTAAPAAQAAQPAAAAQSPIQQRWPGP